MGIFKEHRTFDEILPQFLDEKRIVLHRGTYNGYEGRTELFSKWLRKQGLSNTPLIKLTSQYLHNFSVYLANERDLDRPTCGKYRETISSVFKYAMKTDGIKIIPFDRFILPIKKRDHAPKYIPQDKIKILLEDISQHDYQLYLGCQIQYCAAVRPGREMLNLKPGDFDFIGGTIKVSRLNAKMGKCRFADLTKELAGYCRKYGIEGADPNLYVFGKKRKMGNKPICENNLTYRFNKYRDKYGISKKVKFYSFKHTGATDLINSKLASLPQLQKHLGHDRISSTEHYILEHSGLTNEIIKQQFTSPMALVG